eukprot:3753065-Rhodomonas_salina.2
MGRGRGSSMAAQIKLHLRFLPTESARAIALWSPVPMLVSSGGTRCAQLLNTRVAQALETLYADSVDGGSGTGAGFMVANEIDPRRAFILSKRCAGAGAPASSLMVTSHRAQVQPRTAAPVCVLVRATCVDAH